MSGKRLITGFLIFLGLFTAALIYTQFFAYYERATGVAFLTIAGAAVPVASYDGIDSASSPLKRRGCFTLDPTALATLAPAVDPTPLTPPFWFRCFDAQAIEQDLASGAARAYAIATDDPKGFATMIAVYPDGRGYLWRQLGAEFAD